MARRNAAHKLLAITSPARPSRSCPRAACRSLSRDRCRVRPAWTTGQRSPRRPSLHSRSGSRSPSPATSRRAGSPASQCRARSSSSSSRRLRSRSPASPSTRCRTASCRCPRFPCQASESPRNSSASCTSFAARRSRLKGPGWWMAGDQGPHRLEANIMHCTISSRKYFALHKPR